jgi:hypothetical protein
LGPEPNQILARFAQAPAPDKHTAYAEMDADEIVQSHTPRDDLRPERAGIECDAHFVAHRFDDFGFNQRQVATAANVRRPMADAKSLTASPPSRLRAWRPRAGGAAGRRRLLVW